MRSRNQFQGRPPKCSKCGTLDCHVALVVPGDPKSGHFWLCGSCELLRENPDAVTGAMPGLPIKERAKPKQKERLWDV